MSTEMKDATHPCPIQGCVRLRKVGHAMCLFHWRKLPKRLSWPFWQGQGDTAACNQFFKDQESKAVKTALLILVLLLPVAGHATGKKGAPPAPDNTSNIYEPFVAGVAAAGAQAFITETQRADQWKSLDPSVRYALRLLVPAAIGFYLGQWAGSFTSGPDRSAQDMGAALAGSQISITLHW